MLPYFFFNSSWWHDLSTTVTRFVGLGDGGSQMVLQTVFTTIMTSWSDGISLGFLDVEVVIVLIPA
jgi:hypothetical protein